MDEEHHAAGVVAEGGVGMGRQIVQQLVDLLNGVGSGNGLFCRQVAKTDKDGVVNGNTIIEENAHHLLNVFEAGSGQEGTGIIWGCVLNFGAKSRLNMGVRRMLRGPG